VGWQVVTVLQLPSSPAHDVLTVGISAKPHQTVSFELDLNIDHIR